MYPFKVRYRQEQALRASTGQVIGAKFGEDRPFSREAIDHNAQNKKTNHNKLMQDIGAFLLWALSQENFPKSRVSAQRLARHRQRHRPERKR